MAVSQEVITLKSNRSKVLHRSVGKKFTVQIDTINGSPVSAFGPDSPTFMHKMIGGAVPSLDQPTTFLFMPGTQCVPVGSIRATLRQNIGDEAQVRYTVRTGSSVQ